MIYFFRFNCGNMWGLGHVYRNISLMNEMMNRGNACVAIINENDVAKAMLLEEGIPFLIVDEYEDADKLIHNLYVNYGGTEKVIFWDRLDSEEAYIQRIVDSGIKIVTYDNYDRSALLATECIITRKVPIDGIFPVLAGPGFQLFKQDVRLFAKKYKTIKHRVNKILLHFGGTDPLGILELCFNALNRLDTFQLEFIAGKGESTDISGRIDSLAGNISVCQGVTDFAKRLFEADLCLVAGGVTMYEASAIGTPMIIISHNEDQSFAASIFERETGSINLGIAKKGMEEDIRKAVIRVSEDFEYRVTSSIRMKAFVGCDGVERVCSILEQVAYTKW